MSITYQDLKEAFSETYQRHKSLEIELRKEIDILVEEFKKSLSSEPLTYRAEDWDGIFFGSAVRSEEKPRVSVSSVAGEENPVTGIAVGESLTPRIGFTLQVAVGGERQGDPMIYLSQKVEIGELLGCLSVWVDSRSFQIANTKNIPKYDDVCSCIKMNLLQQCKG
ncbi:hypothetical protein CJP72_21950 [Citrobacter sp. NCU1]|nr:hypothetical protein [Citrobacter sp. NCU1]